MTGANDPLNPIEGGAITLGERAAGNKPPVRELIQRWVKMLGCLPEARTIYNRDGGVGTAYARCREDSEVTFHTIAEM
jgi:poly(3-hydroxybutyrate) depolymerase